MSELTIDQKLALARTPITRGILATLGSMAIPGKSTCGAGTDGPKSPVVGRNGDIVGWQRNAQRRD